ncbi:MAG: type II toxin-antitoxin system HicA family toxin [Marinilabiliaceae bacterium]|nr:type II toxin-antitoxin system HicA family toxin [Marinilabiliaceae bacterium]
MKRNQFISHLDNHSCVFKREGNNHSIFMNLITGKRAAVPRHSEIKDSLCNEICKQFGIPKIK